ncbi:PfkB family carbohydrate kinase, partial [Klebsiella pneumoniae]
MSILVFGSVNVDITVYAPRLPQPGETLPALRYAIGLGGKGANPAAAAARLGAATAFFGRTGSDEMGAQARGLLADYGLDLA